jgi:RNA polymerase sigma-70 factor (ECF subfamily)
MEWDTTSSILHGLRDYANEHAWDRLFKRFRQPIVAFSRQMGLTEAQAEDAAQETLLAFGEAYKAGKYDRGKGRLSKWLFGIAYRQSLGSRRQQARQEQGCSTTILTQLKDEDSATLVWEREWERDVLGRCMTAARREFESQTIMAFELVVRDELSPTEAAERMAVPIKVIYNAKHRVLQRIRALRQELEDINSPDDEK